MEGRRASLAGRQLQGIGSCVCYFATGTRWVERLPNRLLRDGWKSRSRRGAGGETPRVPRDGVLAGACLTAARERRIRAFGATVVRVPGTYDDAVSEASRRAAAEHDWVLVSDTAGDATDSRGSLVIAAYTLIVQEIADTLQRFPQPTHVFVQAGVGGLAAAMTWWCRQVWPDVPPTIVVVEPLQAACVGVSLAKGRPMPVEGPLQTVADCLSAGKVSERGMADPPKRGGRGGSRRRR